MGRESSFIQGCVWTRVGHDLGSDPMPSLDLYWPCFQIQLNSIRKKTKLYLIRRLQPQKNVNLSVFLFPPWFSSSSVSYTTNVLQGGFMWLSVIFNWPILDQGHAENWSLEAFLACVCWVIRGYTDSIVTAAHRLAACSAGSNHTSVLLHLPIRQEETNYMLCIITWSCFFTLCLKIHIQ